MNSPSADTGDRMTGRYRQKREAILNAAARLFDENGIKGTMLSEVAQQVGLSTNSITYYFKKKEDLVFECLMHTTNTISAIAADAANAATPKERVARFVTGRWKRLAEAAQGQSPAMMSFRDVGELDAAYTKTIFSAYGDMFRRVRGLLAPGPVTSENRMSLTIRTHLLLTSTQWARTWLSNFSVADYERLAAYMCDVLINGLLAPGKPWAPTALDEQVAAVKLPEPSNHGFVAAAIGLLNEVGYNGASIDRISARLSVTKGSFYHHIPSKDDLFAECVSRTLAVVEGMQAAAVAGEGSGGDKLTALARSLVGFHFSPRGPLLRMTAWTELSNLEQFYGQVQPMRQLTQTVVEFLATGMMDGSVRATHQAIAAWMVVGAINGSTTLDKWVPGSEKTDAVSLYLKPFFCGICSD
jgi:AcrR family transcriptional regulator